MRRFIPLHKPHIADNQLKYIADAMDIGKLSSLGKYTELCETFFKEYFNGSTCLLTHSCTDALELIALLIDIKSGDEVIVPSFTFVSTANAFMLRGANIVWADSQSDHPNVSIEHIQTLINSKTKAIVVVHYAGLSIDMDALMSLCILHKIILIEDAAQALHSKYRGRRIGTMGHLATFSFHDTKPISCGEGGLLVINDSTYVAQAYRFLEKGTDRHAFLQGLVNQYQWMSLGSSFAASQLQAACLYAQLEEINWVFSKRKLLWARYVELLNVPQNKVNYRLPKLVDYSENNTSIFYLEILDAKKRNELIVFMNERGVAASFHYLALHKSPMVKKLATMQLPYSEYWTDHLLRLPIHTFLDFEEVDYVVSKLKEFFI
ncbi:MAG: dTDP-4-amino-4,6-dideoxygalactose transaminase [Saprospiraceae bacterium]